MPKPNESEAEHRARMKEGSRESRLSFQNRAEHLLRRDMKDDAKEKCKDYIRSFAECSKENGLMVVINCQDKLKDLNGCMAIHNGEEAWQKYKAAHKEELAIRSRGGKVV